MDTPEQHTQTPEQPVQQVNNVQIPTPLKSKKKFIIIGIVIFALLLIVGSSFAAYQFVKKPQMQNKQTFSITPTLNLNQSININRKTYTNNQYGFSIQYPDYFATPSAHQDNGYFLITSQSKLRDSENISIKIRQNIDNLSLNDPQGIFNAMVDYKYFPGPINPKKIEKINIQNTTLYELKDCCTTAWESTASILLATIQNNLLYQIRVYPQTASGPNIQKMINSLHFFTPSPAPTPYVFNSTLVNSWKMYKDKHFSISFPPNFTVSRSVFDDQITIYPRLSISGKTKSSYFITITSSKNTEGLSMDDFRELFSDYDFEHALDNTTFYNYQLDGYKSVRADHILLVIRDSSSTKESDIRTIKDGRVYDIALSPDEHSLPKSTDVSQMKKTFNQILSTFRFTQ